VDTGYSTPVIGDSANFLSMKGWQLSCPNVIGKWLSTFCRIFGDPLLWLNECLSGQQPIYRFAKLPADSPLCGRCRKPMLAFCSRSCFQLALIISIPLSAPAQFSWTGGYLPPSQKLSFSPNCSWRGLNVPPAWPKFGRFHWLLPTGPVAPPKVGSWCD